MTLVREDADGIFVITGGYKFRPGGIVGESHARRMDDGSLKKGDTIKARHIAGTSIARLRLNDGTVTFWANQYQHDLLPSRRKDNDPDAVWLANGIRDWSVGKNK